MTNARMRAAHAASQQVAPLRDGVADVEKLPVAESRACQPVGRKRTAYLIDALVGLGYRGHVTDPPARASVRAISSSRSAWCSRNGIAESLALIFPAEAYAAR